MYRWSSAYPRKGCSRPVFSTIALISCLVDRHSRRSLSPLSARECNVAGARRTTPGIEDTTTAPGTGKHLCDCFIHRRAGRPECGYWLPTLGMLSSTSERVTVRIAVLKHVCALSCAYTFSPAYIQTESCWGYLSAVNHNTQTQNVVRATGGAYQKIIAFLDAHYSGRLGKRDWHQMLGLQPVPHPLTGDVAWVCDRHRHAYLARAASSSTTQAIPARP